LSYVWVFSQSLSITTCMWRVYKSQTAFSTFYEQILLVKFVGLKCTSEVVIWLPRHIIFEDIWQVKLLQDSFWPIYFLSSAKLRKKKKKKSITDLSPDHTNAFSLSMKTHQSIRVHTTIWMRFRQSTLKRSKTIEMHVAKRLPTSRGALKFNSSA